MSFCWFFSLLINCWSSFALDSSLPDGSVSLLYEADHPQFCLAALPITIWAWARKIFIQDFFTHLTIWAQHHFFWPWKTHRVVWIMSPPSQCFFPHSNKCFLTTIHEVCLSGMFLFSVWVATFLTFSVLHVGSYYCYDNPAALEKTIEQVGS